MAEFGNKNANVEPDNKACIADISPHIVEIPYVAKWNSGKK